METEKNGLKENTVQEVSSFSKKITLTFKDKDKEILKKLQSLSNQATIAKNGKKVTVTEVIRFAVNNLKDDQKTIDEIVESTMGSWDKINIECERYNQKNETNLSLEEFLLVKLKIQKH